jgi:starch-binding outer membrane protein, SusD/RagB family
MRNSPANIRRDMVCTDPLSSYYGDIVTIDMLDPNTLERLYPIWTKFAPIDDWGYEDLENGGNIDGQLRTYIYQDDYACRLAETYLKRAEAHMRKGEMTNAAADSNVLRFRAQCAHLVTEAEVNLDLILA